MTGSEYSQRRTDSDPAAGGAGDPDAPTTAVRREDIANAAPSVPQTSLTPGSLPGPDDRDAGRPAPPTTDSGPSVTDPPAAPASAAPSSRPRSGSVDPQDDEHPDHHRVDRSASGSPTAAHQPTGYSNTGTSNTGTSNTARPSTDPGATTAFAATSVGSPPTTPPGAMPAWQSAPAGGPPAGSAPAGSTPIGSSAVQAEPGTFFSQPPRTGEPDIAPPKARVWQNLLGAVAGLVLVLGPVILFAVLAGTPDSLFDAATGRRLLVLGMIVVAALPALLAGWAPATAWLPGGLLAVIGTIAWFSDSFTLQLRDWSVDLFGTGVVGQFIASVGIFLGFALLFAGLGTVWARRSGVDSVLDRISPNP